MHVHLPKALHSWREVAGEVAIIVVGIVIALGGEQVIENRHWHEKETEAREAIHTELAQNAGVYDERMMLQQCLDRRLEEVGVVLKEARQTGVLPDISEIGRPATRPELTSAYRSALNSGVLAKLERDERIAVTGLYDQQSTNDQLSIGEQELWAALRTIEHQPGKVSDQTLALAGDAHARLVFISFLAGIQAEQLRDRTNALGIATSYYSIFDKEGSRAEVVALNSKRPVCDPLTADERPVIVPLSAP